MLGALMLLVGFPAASFGQNQQRQPAAKKYQRISVAEIQKHVDRDWVRKSEVNDLLDYWVKASVMPNGFIQENLDRQWKPWGEQREASLNGQGRVLYTLAIGYEMSGGEKSYLDAITKAADFLIKMRDEKYGGYYNRMTPDLKVIDDTKTGYQSFVIFSLAHAARVTKNKKYADAAMQEYHDLKAKMSDGPFVGSGNLTRDFSKTAPFNMRSSAPAGAARSRRGADQKDAAPRGGSSRWPRAGI